MDTHDYFGDLNKFKVVDLKALLKKHGYKMTGNKPDLIQRILDMGLYLKAYDDDKKVEYTGRTGSSRVRVDYAYDSMTIPMLKTILKGYMLKLTGRKKELIDRIKAHVSKQDDDDDWKPKVISGTDPTLEELEALELPEYVPTNLLLPKKKEVIDKVADKAIEEIGTTLNKFMEIGKEINEPLTKFKPDSLISYIGYLNIYDKYNKKSIIVTRYNSKINRLGIHIRIPKQTSKDFKSGLLFNSENIPLDIETLAHDIGYYITQYDEDAIVIPFTFIHTKGAHANLLVYRPREKIIEWFEPHNKFMNVKKISNYINIGLRNLINSSIFKKLLGNIILIDSHVLVNDKYGSITPKKDIRLQGSSSGGTCLIWCILIAELVFLNPQLRTTEIIHDIFDVALNKEKRTTLNNIMKGYIVGIEKEVTKYLREFLNNTDINSTIKYNVKRSKKEQEIQDQYLSNILYRKLIPKINIPK
jgi:predicted RNA-binding protein Jag